MTETRIHPDTGSTLRRDVRQQVVAFGSMRRTVEVPGWYPDDDGDSIHTGAELAESDRVFQELKAAYAAHVRRVRKRLNLTQEEAGRIIGGGRRAFQKYESGATPAERRRRGPDRASRAPPGGDRVPAIDPVGGVGGPSELDHTGGPLFHSIRDDHRC